MDFVKTNFAGGINQLLDPTKLALGNEVYFASNLRTRKNTARPVRKPLDITGGLTNQQMQGLYAAGQYLLLFASGHAFSYDTSAPSATWQSIPQFQMGSTQKRVYAELIPASSLNFTRHSGTNVNSPVVLTSTAFSGSPVAGIVCDGVKQPWLIFPDLTSRVTVAYVNGAVLSEYVPVGTFPMLGDSNNLYMAMKDATGRLTQLVRSVSGQPLNFSINIDNAGKSAGDALTTAYSVGWDEITSLKRVQSAQAGFVLSTRQAAYNILPDINNLIFGEPTFANIRLFPYGALNNESLVDVVGDTAIINEYGITSFNSIHNYAWEGRNSPFSAKISLLTDGIVQGTNGDFTLGPATVSFDNYVAFAVRTKYGAGVLWYDTIAQCWTSLDLYSGVGQIIQFATAVSPGRRRLFFYTEDNRVYEAFAGATVETASLYIGDLLTQSGSRFHKLDYAIASFGNFAAAGNAELTMIGDRVIQGQYPVSLTPAQVWPQNVARSSVPFDLNATSADTAVVNFATKDSAKLSRRLGAFFQWNADADLLELDISTSEQNRQTVPAAFTQGSATPVKIAIVGSDGQQFSAQKWNAVQAIDADYVLLNGDLWLVTQTADFYALSLGDLLGDLIPWGSSFIRRSQPEDATFLIAGTDVRLIVSNIAWNSGNLPTPFDPTNPVFAWLNGLSTDKRNVLCSYDAPAFGGSYDQSGTDISNRLMGLKYPNINAWVGGTVKAYQRAVWNGLPIFNCGSGETIVDASNGNPYTEQFITTPGFLVLTILPLSLTFTYYDLNGKVLDEYIVRN